MCSTPVAPRPSRTPPVSYNPFPTTGGAYTLTLQLQYLGVASQGDGVTAYNIASSTTPLFQIWQDTSGGLRATYNGAHIWSRGTDSHRACLPVGQQRFRPLHLLGGWQRGGQRHRRQRLPNLPGLRQFGHRLAELVDLVPVRLRAGDVWCGQCRAHADANQHTDATNTPVDPLPAH